MLRALRLAYATKGPRPRPNMTPARGTAIAAAYEQLRSAPGDSSVRRAYSALAADVEYQFKRLPVRVEFTSKDPYRSSREMREDVARGRLAVYTGGNEHPLLTPEQNLKFRAVHDYYGHAVHGFDFGVQGEEGAYLAHRRAFSPAARPALATETRGQNSWFNWSRTNRDLPRPQRAFAEQKAALLRDWT